jgi:hypothetical protein
MSDVMVIIGTAGDAVDLNYVDLVASCSAAAE